MAALRRARGLSRGGWGGGGAVKGQRKGVVRWCAGGGGVSCHTLPSPCCRRLADLLLSLDTDEETLRDVIGALKNMSEFPAARKAIERYMRKHGMPSEQLNMYDSKPWPQSIRYLHQNFAPGGQTATHEAAVRKRWGYPDPISA